jgi:hypothetical protein
MASDVEIRFGGTLSGLTAAVQGAREEIEGLAAPVAALSSAFSALGEAMVAGFAIDRLGEAVGRVIDLGASLEHMSESTGISVENLSRLQYAAQLTDVNLEGLQRGVRTLATAISYALYEPTGRQAMAFQAAGISAEFLKEHSNDAWSILLKLADAFHNSTDGALKQAIAAVLLGGRYGDKLIPMLNQGSAGLLLMGKASDELGRTMTGPMAEGLDEAHRGLVLMEAGASGLWQTIVSKLAPAIAVLGDAFARAFAPAALPSGQIVELVTELDAKVRQVQAERDAEAARGGWFGPDVAALKILDDQLAGLRARLAEAKAALAGSDFLSAFGGEGAKGQLGALERQTAAKSGGQNVMAAWKAQLDEIIAAEGAFGARSREIELNFWEQKLATATKGTAEYAAILARVLPLREAEAKAESDAVRKAAEEEARVDQVRVEDQMRLDERGVANKRRVLNEELAAKQISVAEWAHQSQSLADLEYNIELHGLADLKAINAGKLAEIQRIDDQIKALKQKHADEIVEIERKAAKDTDKAWQDEMRSFRDLFASAWNDITRGILQGTLTWRALLAKSADDALAIFSRMVEKEVADWLFAEHAKDAASAAGNAARVASDQAGALGSLESMLQSVVKSIEAFAGETFAGVFAFLSGIMGPAAAGPAAAAEAEVMSMTGLVALDVGAWTIPRDLTAQLHAGEMVVPANFATGLRATGRLPEAGASGGHMFNITVNASHDGKMSGPELAALIAGEIRRANPGVRGW